MRTEDVLTSKSPNSVRKELLDNRDDSEYRHAYADESLNLSVATQIKVLREQRSWTQEGLADEAEMQQPMISRYENVNYSSWSVKTLKKLAKAYDVILDIRFRSFGDLVTITEGFSRESLQVPPFDEDLFFKVAAQTVLSVDEIQVPPQHRGKVLPIEEILMQDEILMQLAQKGQQQLEQKDQLQYAPKQKDQLQYAPIERVLRGAAYASGGNPTS